MTPAYLLMRMAETHGLRRSEVLLADRIRRTRALFDLGAIDLVTHCRRIGFYIVALCLLHTILDQLATTNTPES